MPTDNETEQATLSSGSSPILALPAEITTQIFTHCVPDRLDLVGQPDPNAAPLLLGRICSSWRSIAEGSPEL
jgi:hypothetical protein